jgi:glyoxylase-like metal-dependent hydrolase (beta-lactamase superfamily II)
MTITLLNARNPGPMTGGGNNTYLVGRRACVLIDAGTGDPRHLDALQSALDERGATLSRVVVTHAHMDHIGGVSAIAGRWPGVPFAKMPWPERDGKYGTFEALGDGDRVTGCDIALDVVHTPGHAPDHISLWAAEEGVLFSGDLVTTSGTVVIPGTRGGDLREYLASLERVRALGAKRLLPAHGDAIENPAKLIETYIEHRLVREKQILGALQEGCTTPAAIVDRVYVGVSADLRPMAEESVVAHLLKLQSEGRVEHAADNWRPVSSLSPGHLGEG